MSGAEGDERAVSAHFEFVVDWRAGSPSARDGVPRAAEAQLRAFGCAAVAASCVSLGVPQVVAATGQTLLQRFYCRRSLRQSDVRHVALACKFLACKVEEYERAWHDVVHVAHRVFLAFAGVPYEPLDRSSSEPRHGFNYWDLKSALFAAEQTVLTALGFLVSGAAARRPPRRCCGAPLCSHAPAAASRARAQVFAQFSQRARSRRRASAACVEFGQ